MRMVRMHRAGMIQAHVAALLVSSSLLVIGPGTAARADAPPATLADVVRRFEAARRKDRLEREAERREREARRLSLHVTGSYGVITFPDGVVGIDDTKLASLKGVGIRVTKGISPMLALEGDIAGALSATATFREVRDGVDLTRAVWLGRVSLGGALRLGGVDATVIPVLRFGLGFQLVNRDAKLVSSTGPAGGPGAGLEFGGSAHGGAGVDVKLGSRLLAGVGLLFTAGQSDQRILDLGLNLAYRFGAPE